ncbi:alpha/beta hydrolase [Paenibacillus sp. UKAQ_18]|nr:alpha/beta hydrolase [Paenibacillus sp. UKAQ_18]
MARIICRIPYLTTPSLYGGHAEEAFDVIIPSLPGFAFSSKPTRPGVGSKYVATLWAKLMDRLGYESYLVQGGDIGAGVSTWLAFMYPERVRGLHLNYIPGSYKPPLTQNTPSVSEEEQWLEREGAYSALHRTKPETLAFSLDHILTNISIYWFTNSIASSIRIYTEGTKMPLHFTEGQCVTVPTGVSLFPKELPTPPRSWVERVYNITYWEKANKGGHFAAMENHRLFADHLNHFFHSLSI